MFYKLTDTKGHVRDTYAGNYGCREWGVDVTHNADWVRKSLNTPGTIKAYTFPLMAVLHDSHHYGDFLLWECSSEDESPIRTNHFEVGVSNLTTIKTIEVPSIDMGEIGLYLAGELPLSTWTEYLLESPYENWMASTMIYNASQQNIYHKDNTYHNLEGLILEILGRQWIWKK